MPSPHNFLCLEPSITDVASHLNINVNNPNSTMKQTRDENIAKITANKADNEKIDLPILAK